MMAGVLFFLSTVKAQNMQVTDEKEGYGQVIAKRTAKIVAALKSTDSAFNSKVQNIIVDQYYNLSITHDARSSQIRAIKNQDAELTEDEKEHIRRIEANAQQQLEHLHTQFLGRLAEICTPQQVDQIKDGMTYGVLQVTYKAYQDMLPNLTSEQKKQILAWLTEARELAMDAESSEKKHAVFGKYKGRINNYLSAAGIDMKKAEADWQQRLKERAAAGQQ
jgi:Spy/CpxP family protein refolding chaperone